MTRILKTKRFTVDLGSKSWGWSLLPCYDLFLADGILGLYLRFLKGTFTIFIDLNKDRRG
jgi:hypothetical protein